MKNIRKEDELSAYVEAVRADIRHAGVPISDSCGSNCQLNFRLSTRLGRCFVGGPRKGLIEINGDFFVCEPDDFKVKETIAHEMLHDLFPNDHHGGNWKKYAIQISEKNKHYRDLSKARYDPWDNMSSWQKKRKEEVPKYEIFCPSCNLRWIYKRKCRTVDYGMRGYLECPKCNSELEVRNKIEL